MLTSPIGLDLARNPVVVNVDPWDLVGIALRSRVRYELDVKIFNGATYDLAASLAVDEEPAQKAAGSLVYRGAFFRIDAVLRSNFFVIDYAAALDTLLAGGVSELTDLVMKYYTVTRVYVDNSLMSTVTNAERWAYNGAVSEVDWEAYNVDFFTNYIGANGRFLNCGRVTTPDGFLTAAWMYNYGEVIVSLRLKSVGKYAGGAEATVFTTVAMPAKAMGVYVLPIGGLHVIQQAGEVGKLNGEDLLYYTISVVDELDVEISEQVKVLVRKEYFRNKREVVYLDGLNVPAAFVAAGQSAEEMEFEKIEGEAFRGFGYEAWLTERRVDVINGHRKYLLRTSWLKNDDAKQLAAIGFAKNIFLRDAGKWLPLVLTNKALPLKNDNSDWTGLELSLELGYTEAAWSDLPAKAQAVGRPKSWRPYSTACQLDTKGRYNGILEVINLEEFYLDTNLGVKPIRIKPNRAGDANYVAPVESAGCVFANTPFLSQVQTKTGSYNRIGCLIGERGEPATITVAAQAWGSTLSLASANAKAVDELNALDTQEYANLYGSCTTIGSYDYSPGTIPGGRWWIRENGLSYISGIAADVNAYRPGNLWAQNAINQPDQTDVFLHPNPRYNISYPVLTPPRKYVLHVNYNYSQSTVKFYKNGVLVGTSVLDVFFGNTQIDFPVNPASGDRWFIEVT